jgi:Holliday junction resolvasome RuvABC DNA-binding subunit
VALGINKVQAEASIKKVSNTDNNIHNLEELIKKALKAI